MADFDIEAIRAEVRAMDFTRGTPAEVAMWREDMADSRANLVIEDMVPTPNDDAFFDLMLDEGVSPPLFIDETWAKTNMGSVHRTDPDIR